MTNFKKVSVVIPTYNRGNALCNTLESIFKNDYRNYEVIVVDQTQQYPDKIRTYIDNLIVNKKIRYYKLDTPSTSAAKNCGIKNAFGDIIVFLDDDIVADSRLLSTYVKVFDENKDISGIAGQVLLDGGCVKQKLDDRAKKMYIGLDFMHFDHMERQFVQCAQGCNCAFIKDVIVKAGLFDENYIGNAYREETDLHYRIINKLHGRILFEPDAKVLHLRVMSGGCRTDLVLNRDFYRNNFYFIFKNYPFKYFLHGIINLFKSQSYLIKEDHKPTKLHDMIVLFLKANRAMSYGIFDCIALKINNLHTIR